MKTHMPAKSMAITTSPNLSTDDSLHSTTHGTGLLLIFWGAVLEALPTIAMK